MKNSAFLKYIISLLIFGTNGVVASFIPLSGAEIVLTRTVLGSLFLIAVFVLSGNRVRFSEMKRQWAPMLFSGVSMALSWVCLFEAYRKVGVSVATLEYYCGPVMVLALSPLLFKEKLSRIRVAGIILVLLGMFAVNGSRVTFSGSAAGHVYGFLSAVFYAVMIVSNKKVRNLSGLELTMAQLVTACVAVAPYVFLTRQGAVALHVSAVLAILFLGIVNSGIACYLYFSSIHCLPAQTVAICSYTDPLSALFFSALFLGERMSQLQILGAVLILGGAAMGELLNACISSRESSRGRAGK